MDELVIGGKQYISSRRAAEITGYAKDYIGQLCRGKRIEGKLVGRNWYVEPRSLLHLSAKKNTDSADQNEIFSKKDNPSSSSKILEESTFSYEPENVAYESDESPLVPMLASRRSKEIETLPAVVESEAQEEAVSSYEENAYPEEENATPTPVIKVQKVAVKPSANAVDLRIMGLIQDTERRRQETREVEQVRAQRETRVAEEAHPPKINKKQGVSMPRFALVPALSFAVAVASLIFILGSVTDKIHAYPNGGAQYSISTLESLSASASEGFKNLGKTR